MDISASGEFITAGSQDTQVYLFGRNSSTPLWNHTPEYQYDNADNVWAVAISPYGDYIAAGTTVTGPGDKTEGSVVIYNNSLANPPIPPVAVIDSISPSPARFDAEVTFNGSGSDSDGTVIAYEWSSNIEGFLSHDKDFSITGFSPGTHNITFRVQDNDGEWSEWSASRLIIYPNKRPVATIDSITPSPARFSDEITFNGSGYDNDGFITAYQWKSDYDGDLSDLRNFSISNLLGDHTHKISFRVKDNDGNWSYWVTQDLAIYSNIRPIATIDSIHPSPAGVDSQVTFNGTAARVDSQVIFNGTGADSDGTIVVYFWESSIDGFLSNDKDFTTAGLSKGNHTIYFQVKDNDGGWSDDSQWGLWIYTVPVAIAGQNSTGTPGVPLQFSGAATDEDGTIAKYEWDFDGDGIFEWSSTENGLNTYIYNNEGTYTATLRVTDNDGFTSTDTVEITISEKKVQIDDEGNVTVTDAEEDEGGIPALSMIPALISIGLIAIFRRK